MKTLAGKITKSVKYWWLFVLLGILLVAGGFWVLSTPVESYITLAIFFSVLVFMNGIFDIFFSVSNQDSLNGWGWYLGGGILETLLGIVLMIYQGLTMAILPLLLGFWLLFGAISIISGAFELRSLEAKGWGWILTSGILLLILSFVILANPLFGSGIIVASTALGIILYGVGYIILGIKLRKIKGSVQEFRKQILDNLEELKIQVLSAYGESSDDNVRRTRIGEQFESFKKTLA